MAFLGGTRRRPGGSTHVMSMAGEAGSAAGWCTAGLGDALWDATEIGEPVLEPAPGGSGVFRQATPPALATARPENREKARISRLKRPAMRVPASSMCAP